ncbi:ribose 1,5-bisphosphokinase [Modicisalibacter radicis]|uniref:ribose 1,5-bisphosphokinase n=1 Tax=Halomonas sp. EAR18 TaxID=2518972 RepID=UPI00109D6DB3|nr:ribose 1,5-bisphosphokinase [Halomonas sp. EAR18]
MLRKDPDSEVSTEAGAETRTETGAKRARLVYLMGASGVGKDSLLDEVRRHRPEWLVAHRYITRPSGTSENCVSLTAEEFERRRRLGLFCLDWHAHGLDYGLGIEIPAWLERDQVVIVNGSRRALATARERFGDRLLPVLVTAQPSVLRERLIRRGRETRHEIEARLRRHRQLEATLDGIARIDNSRELPHTVAALQALLLAECPA